MIQKRSNKLAALIILSMLIVSILPGPALSNITTSGEIDPTYDGSDPWNLSESLNIGIILEGTMEISNGSTVNSVRGYIGKQAPGIGTVTVTNNDSLWNISKVLYVGVWGSGYMTVSDGGRVASSNSYAGYTIYGDADIEITGSGSVWENSSNLYVGYKGNADVVISNAGMITDVNGYIGYTTGIGSVTVTGPNSLWHNSEGLFLGYGGTGNMTISDGGMVTGTNAYVGHVEKGVGNATVTGQNSLWENSQNLFLGYGSVGNMTISDGGKVTGTNAYVGHDVNSVGTATVTGQSSLWHNSEGLFLGYGGTGNMTISDSGTVTGTNAYIGYNVSGVGTAIVTGQSSLWDNSANLYIGGSATSAGGTGLLNIIDGGIVEAENVTIWSTGIVSGDSVLRANTVTNKGTIKPGNSMGILTIDGNLTMDSGSTLEIEIDNSGNSDKLIVTDDLYITGGKVKPISTETITGSQEYTIVEANNVTGTFDGLDTALLNATFLNIGNKLGYENDSVKLNITPVPFDDPSILTTSNQRELGSALQQIANGGGNSITTALQGLRSIDQVRSAYNQLSGQSRPSLAPVTVVGTTNFRGTVSDRLHSIHDGAYHESGSDPLSEMIKLLSDNNTTSSYDVTPYDPTFSFGNGTNYLVDEIWGLWGKGYGVFGDRETEDGVPSYQYTIYGAAFGVDYQYSDNLLLGMTIGYSNGNVDYYSSRDKSNLSSIPIGVYGSWDANDWYVDSILSFAHLKYETKRYVDVTADKLSGDFNGDEISCYLEGGLNRRFRQDYLIQPLASFQVAYVNLDSYTESGGVSRLAYDAQSYESYKGSLGMKLIKQLGKCTDELSSSVELRGRWVHEFGDANTFVNAHFASNPSIVFTVSDEEISRDSTVLGIGLRGNLSSGMRLFIDYDTSLNADNTYQIVSAGFVIR